MLAGKAIGDALKGHILLQNVQCKEEDVHEYVHHHMLGHHCMLGTSHHWYTGKLLTLSGQTTKLLATRLVAGRQVCLLKMMQDQYVKH